MKTNNQYRQILTDNFPKTMTISFGNNELLYQKELYTIKDEQGNISENGLRYGENPGQKAAVFRLINGNLSLAGLSYVGPKDSLLSSLSEDALLSFGKHPSKTNLTDVDSALGILRYLMAKPTVAIMKHNNPSGVSQSDSLAQAFTNAYLADRIAAFGGGAVFNRPVDKECAKLMVKYYLEVVAAPDFEPGVLEILLKRKDLRIFKIKNISRLADFAYMRYLDFTSLIDGGLIVQQSADNNILSPADFKPAISQHNGMTYQAQRVPSSRELEDLFFAWAVEQGVVSNSVLYAKNGTTVAIAGGEQDRLGVAEIAIYKAYQKYSDALCFKQYKKPYKEMLLEANQGNENYFEKLEDIQKETEKNKAGLKEAVMVSDAFFPFRDAVDVAIKEGISAIAHPGGSLRDWESIEAINESQPQVAMVFTDQRAFKH